MSELANFRQKQLRELEELTFPSNMEPAWVQLERAMRRQQRRARPRVFSKVGDPVADSYSKTESDAKLEAFEHKLGRQFDQQLGEMRREMEALRGEIRAGFAELSGKVSTMQAGVETRVAEVDGTARVLKTELDGVKGAIKEAKEDQHRSLTVGLTIVTLILALLGIIGPPALEWLNQQNSRPAIEAPTAAPRQLPPVQ